MILDQIKITLRKQLCLFGLSEDAAQAFVSNLQLESTGDDNRTFVTATGGIEVQFLFGSDGNFNGVYAQLGGVSVPILFGTGSKNLEIFEGPPTATNPGPGWETDVEASKRITHVTGAESTWEYFVARRISVVSTIP